MNRVALTAAKLEELERGTIGSHAPMPPEYLQALREQQLMRLNNMHANALGSPAAGTADGMLSVTVCQSCLRSLTSLSEMNPFD